LLTLLEHFHNGRLSLELIANKTSHSVAELFGIRDRGYIREGYWADLVLVDPQRSNVVSADNVLAKCGWSPFEGYEFRSTILATLVNGVFAYRDGALTDAILGQRLECHHR
jgi:dihydroorotase